MCKGSWRQRNLPRGEEACTRVRGLAYSIHSSRFLKAVNQTQKQQTGVVFMLSLYWFSMCFWNGKYWSVAVFGQCDTSWAYSHIALNITHIWIIFKTKCPQLCFAGRFIFGNALMSEQMTHLLGFLRCEMSTTDYQFHFWPQNFQY